MEVLHASEIGESDFRKALKRHYQFLLKRLTLRKALNLMLNLFEMHFKFKKVHSYPPYLRVEVSAVCNLKCPGCLLSAKHDLSGNELKIEKAFMNLNELQENIKDFLPYLLKINLYDEGEPYLNKGINDIVRYLEDNNVSTCISSNFSLKFSDDDLQGIIDSNLDHLIVAVDGVDQESYSSYRVGGDFDLVINNIRRLSAMVEEQKSNLKIEFQYLDFDESEEMRKKAEQLAKELKVWRFMVLHDVSRAGMLELKFSGSRDERLKAGCYQIWLSGSITANGNYYACDYGEDSGFKELGKAKEFKKYNLKNHQDIHQLRRSFSNSDYLNDVCMNCICTKKKKYKKVTKEKL